MFALPMTPSQTRVLGPGCLGISTPETPSSSAEESPAGPSRCLCGRALGNRDDIYCSTACAREDALSSLCFNPRISQSSLHHTPTLPQSDHYETSSTTSASEDDTLSFAPNPTAHARTGSNEVQWSASHYRRVAHEEMRREERREERRRRRAERGSVASTSTSTSTLASTSMADSGDLTTDQRRKHHHRNSSTATFSSLASSSTSRTPSMISSTSTYSAASTGFLSRSGSSASSSSSSSSSRRQGKKSKPPVFAGIMESEEEEEDEEMEAMVAAAELGGRKGLSLRTVDVFSSAYSRQNQGEHLIQPRPIQATLTRERQRAASNSNSTADPMGATRAAQRSRDEFMGKEMKDALDEILDMEQGFTIDTEDEGDSGTSGSGSGGSNPFPFSRGLSRSGSRTQLRGTPSSERLRNGMLPGGPMRYSPSGPPKTPPASASVKKKRSSMIPPNAPLRTGHSFNDLTAPATPSFPAPYARRTSRHVGQSMNGIAGIAPGNNRISHMPTRSEPFGGQLSAAPVIEEMDAHSPSSSYNAFPPRRSLTPIRRSLTFDPASGPPLIPGLTSNRALPSYDRSETPTNDITMQVATPSAPTSSAATFQSSFASSTAFPTNGNNDNNHDLQLPQPSFTRLSRTRTDSTDSVLRFQFPRTSVGASVSSSDSQNMTPVKAGFGRPTAAAPSPTDSSTPTQPNASEGLGAPLSRRLQPSLFPASPYTTGTPPFLNMSEPHSLHAPTSGLMLGVLLGSGNDDAHADAMDVDEAVSPVTGSRIGEGFLPVFLEAEGFEGSSNASHGEW